MEKFWLLTSTSSVTGEENNFLFPSLKGGKLERKIFAPTLKGEIFLNCKGRKIVWGKLFIVTSALKSQRRVRCEFGVVCFLEIDCLLREIN